MPDLVVDTDALRAAALSLRIVSRAAADLGAKSGRLTSYVPALGLAGPAQAVDSFLSEWVYGIGWIGVQAHAIAGLLESTAAAFEAIEADLSRGVEHVGQVNIPIPSAGSDPAPEPVRPTSGTQWGLLAASTSPVDVQLSSARHARELVAGDPEMVADLARLLDAFALAIADARTELAYVNLSGWTSACAVMVIEQLTQLQGRLVSADQAFAIASLALAAYAREHASARSDAAVALAMWQSAEHASAVLHGAVVGELPAPGAADPAPEMARAVLKLRSALDAWEATGRVLTVQLRDAEAGAPDDPGLMAALARAASSFGAGFAQGVVGMGQGALALGALALALVPTRAIYEPKEYLNTWEHLAKGAWWGLNNTDKVGASLLDVEGLKSNPFRWAGKLTPEIITLLGTAGAAGTAKGAEVTEDLLAARHVIDDAARTGRPLAAGPGEAAIRTEIGLQNVPIESAAGQAIRGQLDGLERADSWSNVSLPVGQRVMLVDPDSGFGMGALIQGDISRSAGEFFEGIQVSGSRSSIGPPVLPESIRVFEVMDVDLDAAHAVARANVQAGAGGGTRVFVDDVDQAIHSGRLVELNPHWFDPNSTRGRMEDAEFLRADPTLPHQAVDPAVEQAKEAAKVGGLNVARNVVGTGAVAAERLTEPSN